jgi:hypothetical protein
VCLCDLSKAPVFLVALIPPGVWRAVKDHDCFLFSSSPSPLPAENDTQKSRILACCWLWGTCGVWIICRLKYHPLRAPISWCFHTYCALNFWFDRPVDDESVVTWVQDEKKCKCRKYDWIKNISKVRELTCILSYIRIKDSLRLTLLSKAVKYSPIIKPFHIKVIQFKEKICYIREVWLQSARELLPEIGVQ